MRFRCGWRLAKDRRFMGVHRSRDNVVRLGEIPLSRDKTVEIADGCKITIFPYTLEFDCPLGTRVSEDVERTKLDLEMSAVLEKIHKSLVEHMGKDLKSDDQDWLESQQQKVEQRIDLYAQAEGFPTKNLPLLNHLAGNAVKSYILEQLSQNSSQVSSDLAINAAWYRMVTVVPPREQELQSTAQHLLQSLGITKKEDVQEKLIVVDQSFFSHWKKVCDQLDIAFRVYLSNRFLKRQLKDILFGYGPLEDLLRLPAVTEIMVVSKDKIYIDGENGIQKSGRQFISEAVTTTIIERIVSRVSRRIDRSEPMVDARLKDGSRVNAVIAPLAVSGPCLTIRKFPARKLTISELIKKKSITETASNFLRAAVLHKRNILVSGGTGTGKTTLLNCLSDYIPDSDRIVTIEDVAELQLKKAHVVKLETKKKNAQGKGEVTISDLVTNALRMRPDRIVVGECRGAEALDMLQAMNTGHGGSMTTIHANTAEDVVMRLEVMVQKASGNLPVSSIYRQIGSAIDVVVQLERLRNNRKCVVQISEVLGCDPMTGKVLIRDLFLMDGESLDSVLVPTGHLPSFMGELIEREYLNLETFYEEAKA